LFGGTRLDKKISIENVELPKGLLGTEITVFAVQLKSPFYDELSESSTPENNVFAWKPDSQRMFPILRRERIRNLLADLKIITKKRKINILVFPEYSLEDKSLVDLENFCKENKIIVVGGYYDFSRRLSVATILIPGHDSVLKHSQFRWSVSKGDADYVAHEPRNIPTFTKFLWSATAPNGDIRQHFLHVFVCLDFLTSALQTVDVSVPGLVIAPLSSSRVEEFYGISSALIRSVEGFQSIVVILCNSTDTNRAKQILISCGKTQFVGPGSKANHVIEPYREAGLLATLNFDSLLTIPTRISSEPYVVTSQTTFSIDALGHIIEPEGINAEYLEVNPNILISEIGLHRTYALCVMNNYYPFRTNIKSHYVPITIHGIFGGYDVLVQAHEESWGFFDMRLQYYLGSDYDGLKAKQEPDHYEVTHVIKHRKRLLMKVGQNGFESNNSYHGLSNFLQENLKNLRNIMLRRPIDNNVKKELLEHNVIYPVASSSDITPEEKSNGQEEFLVFVTLPGNDTDKRIIVPTFQNNVLIPLMNDERVRTLEFCAEGGSDGAQGFTGYYLLHVVGRLDDLRDIIIDRIHQPLKGAGIQLRTRVIPNAESISSETYEALNETIVGKQRQQSVLRIVKAFITRPDPFKIKTLPISQIDSILAFFGNYENLLEKLASPLDKTHTDLRKTMESDMYDFIYCICTAFTSSDKMTHDWQENFAVLCAPVYRNLADNIERILGKAIKQIQDVCVADNLNLYYTKLTKYQIELNKPNLSLGDLVQIVSTWNSHVARDGDKINDNSSYTNDVLGLHKFVPLRNFYSHDTQRKDSSDKLVTGFANDLLVNANSGISFINKWESR
jgi:hypothetical protein